MRPQMTAWRPAFVSGISAGLGLVLAALVGMIEAFEERAILSWPAQLEALGEAFPLHLVVIFGVFTGLGYQAMRRVGSDSGLPGWISAWLSGGLASLVLALFVQFGRWVDLGFMFPNAKPSLYELLSFGQNPFSDIAILLGFGLLWASLGGLLAMISDGWRKHVINGLLAVILLGTLRDVLTRQVDLITRSRSADGIAAKLVDGIYTNQALSIRGAIIVFGLVVAFGMLRPRFMRWWRDRMDAMPAARRGALQKNFGRTQIAALALLLLWLPLGMGTYPSQVMDIVGIYILMGLGLNIVVGFAGLLDLGYVAFYAIGAYTVAVLTSANTGIGWSFWAALPVAVLASILSGVLLGIPVLKTHGDYLAIITLGFGEIIRILAVSDALKEYIGGARGIQLIPVAAQIPKRYFPGVGNMDPQFQQEMYYPILIAVLLALYVSWRLYNSRYGRAWMAVREDEAVAEAMGINLVQTKLMAFATGAAMAGLGGALFASLVQTIFPSSFNLLISINILVLIIVGGMGSIPGVFVGALALVAVPELLREFDDFRMLLYGAVLVLMMLKRPEGLWPTAIAKRELKHSDAGL